MVQEKFCRAEFEDYVTAHGYGEPSGDGCELGEALIAQGSTYAEAAAEVVFRGMTEVSDEHEHV